MVDQEPARNYTPVDFSKAFDTVWRDALFYKLLKLGIRGPFAEMLKNMYSKSSVQIKLREGLTAHFHDNIGVKQGCVLSPTLFKIFISDINKIFNKSCSPVKLYDERISCLMFADDAVLLSETPEGLQHALGKVFFLLFFFIFFYLIIYFYIV